MSSTPSSERSSAQVPKGLNWYWIQFTNLPRELLFKLGLSLGLVAGSLWLFTWVVSEILEAETMQLDLAVVNFLHQNNPSWLPGVMYFITKTGSMPTALTLSAAVLAWLWLRRRNVHAIKIFLLASIGGVILNNLLKIGLHRDRPMLDALVDAIGYSLPSGHAMSAMILYGFMTYLVIRSRRRLWTKLLVGIPLVSYILLIGISRIYLHAHYFSDVIAGYAAGFFWLLACIMTMEFKPWYRKHFSDSPQASGELPGDNTIPPEHMPVAQTTDLEKAEIRLSETGDKSIESTPSVSG